MAISIFLLIALLVTAIFSITTAVAYAQDGGMVKTTSKGTLDVRLAPMWSEGGQASFNVGFLNPGTDTLHEHQDYDFRILKDGQVVFSAARQTGQAVLHNVEGTLTVPYTFQENGDYSIQVYLAGTGISPIIPTDEEATFPIIVTPEFPAGVTAAALAALMMITTTAILLSQRLKLI
jgi:archaellum component FlaF (FlaF/FlaG flagellin family)